MKDLIRSNGFGPFHCQGVEILRRIFVTARDRNWREISPTHWNCQVNETLRTISVEARHVSDLVDFTWQGTLEVSADSQSVRFAFEGEVQRTMEICRLGLIVLHSVESMVGTRITAQGPDGQEMMVIASTIAPQLITNGMPAAMMQPFSSLTIERADMGSMELHFWGDLFEIEDQRNWGDASFKTYCTPLAQGFPREILKGTRIAHRFELRFAPQSMPIMVEATRPALPATRAVFPTIGCNSLAPSPLGSQELHWHHLHIDFSNPDDLVGLRARFDPQTVPLEIAVQDRSSDEHRSTLDFWIAVHSKRISRVLLYGEGVSPPAAVCIANWRRALHAVGATDVPLFAATRGYFVEFNRSTTLKGATSGISFPLTATVHSDEPRTIGENVATILDIAETVRHWAQSSILAIAPLALYYPASLTSSQFPHELIAPWLAATLMYAGAAGVTSVTLADDIVSRAPVFFLRRLLQCANHVVTLLVDQPFGVHAAVLHQPAQSTAAILAVNLNTEPVYLQVRGIAESQWQLGNVSERGPFLTEETQTKIPRFGVCWLECHLN